ncbi:MAG: hypothetical protein QOH60_1064, partial [Mycobacterium sp.]|nr:hypothetical protein [Mycobacterium sp.]
MRVPAAAAESLTNTDSGTLSPVSASRARDDVPDVPSSTDADDTRLPRIRDMTAASRSSTRRGKR